MKNKINWYSALSLSALMFCSYSGPGFASGTQTMSYFMTKGYIGIFIGPLLCGLIVFTWCSLFFEFNRIYKPKDFREQSDMMYGDNKFRVIMGTLLDVFTFFDIFLVMSAMISGASILLSNMFGISILSGTLLFAGLITLFSLLGPQLILRFGSALTLCILMITLFIAVTGIPKLWPASHEYLAKRLTPPDFGFTWPYGIFVMLTITVAMLSGKNAAVPSCSNLKSRSESLIAALGAGLMCSLGTMVYTVIFAAGIPEILNESIPTLYAIETMINAGPVSVILYSILASSAMLSAGVALMYGGLTRYVPMIRDISRFKNEKLIKISVCAFFITGSGILSSFGIMKIISVGYTTATIIAAPLLLWICFIMIPYRMIKDRKWQTV